MRCRHWVMIRALVAVGVAAGCGCSSSNSPPAGEASPSLSLPDNGGGAGRTASPDAIFATDPSAARLQDIGGALLLYYGANKQMPTQLNGLHSDDGSLIEVTSPKTGQPYVYVREGLWLTAQSDRCIVAYDGGLSGNGRRWCLFMLQPKAHSALTVEVVLLPEGMFQKYKPAGS